MKFSAVLPSLNPKSEWLMQALAGCRPFDEVLVHIEHSDHFYLGDPNKVNRLIELAIGDWICFIYDDDWFDPQALQQAMNFAKTTKADVIVTPFFQVSAERTYIEGEKNIDDSIYKENYLNPANLFRKSVWNKIKFNDKYASDWIYWVKAYRAGFKFEYIDLPYYHHRVRPDSACRVEYAEFGNDFEKYRQHFLKQVGAENENR